MESDASLTFLRIDEEMSTARNPSDFTVAALKEKLKTRGLSVVGSKNELINRLMEADCEIEWLGDGSDVGSPENQDTLETPEGEAGVSLREIEMLTRERELLERELALARRETEFLRASEREREGGRARKSRPSGG